MTKSQLIYAILATFCWGSYVVVAKVASSERYCSVPPRWTVFLMSLGILAVFAVYWVFSTSRPFQPAISSLAAGVGSGALWAMGMIFALLALRAGADVARLVPIYNSNTLIAVVLGIVLLREIPETREVAKVLLGSLLIVIGGLLVAR